METLSNSRNTRRDDSRSKCDGKTHPAQGHGYDPFLRLRPIFGICTICGGKGNNLVSLHFAVWCGYFLQCITFLSIRACFFILRPLDRGGKDRNFEAVNFKTFIDVGLLILPAERLEYHREVAFREIRLQIARKLANVQLCIR